MPLSNRVRPTEWVPANTIRQYFNNGGYYHDVQTGRLVERRRKNLHLKNPPISEPYCTHSQIVFYYTQAGKPVAVIHQYMRPDGTLGGSGLPDPKCLYLPDRILHVMTK